MFGGCVWASSNVSREGKGCGLPKLPCVIHFHTMDEEDFLPQKKKPQLKKLDSLSVDELRDYILELKAEIERVEAEIKRKKASADAASLFFKKAE